MLKKEGVAELIKTDGEYTTNDKEKCEVINEFFSTVFTKEDLSDIPDFVYEGKINEPLLNCINNIY